MASPVHKSFCVLPLRKIYDPFFFNEKTVRHWIPAYSIVLSFPSAKWVRTSKLNLAIRWCSSSFYLKYARLVERCSDVLVRITCLLSMTSLVSRYHTMWFVSVGVYEGPCVPTIATRRPVRLEKKDCCCCWVHHSRNTDQCLGGIRLSARYVPCDEWCLQWTFLRNSVKTLRVSL